MLARNFVRSLLLVLLISACADGPVSVPEAETSRVVVAAQRVWLDVHIGVVTSDVGCQSGLGWRTGGLTNGHFIVDWKHLDGTRTTNIRPERTLRGVFTDMVAAGHHACGTRRPLDAAMAALDDRAFRREDAELLVWFIAAGDDEGSMTTSSALADALRAVRRRHRLSRVGVAAPKRARRLASVSSSRAT